MSETTELVVKTVDNLGMDALTAFAKLRTYTPGRATFLLESLNSEQAEGRYSIVAYRVHRAELLPPGVDPIAIQSKEAEDAPRPETFAQALASGCAGYISSGITNLHHRIRMCDDEGPSAQFAVGATVMVFDHQENTITVAGRKKGNLVERIIWEAQNGPEVPSVGSWQEGASPDKLSTVLSDEQLAAKCTRAQAFISDELEQLSLAHTYYAPINNADPFDVYRVMRANNSAKHGYFMDMGQLPSTPSIQLMGVSEKLVYSRHRHHENSSLTAVLYDALLDRETIGEPALAAAKMIRRLEDSSRQLWGGAVGYLCPGGEAGFVLADQLVSAQAGNFWHTVATTVDSENDPLQASEQARARATLGLAAICAAQEAANAAE